MLDHSFKQTEEGEGDDKPRSPNNFSVSFYFKLAQLNFNKKVTKVSKYLRTPECVEWHGRYGSAWSTDRHSSGAILSGTSTRPGVVSSRKLFAA